MLRHTLTLSLIAGALLSACSTAPHNQQFIAPSTQAIADSHKRAISHVDSARKTAEEIGRLAPVVAKQVESLRGDLDSARSELDASEGARTQIDAQLHDQAQRANTISAAYDKAAVTIGDLKESRHRWVKYLMLSLALNVAAIGWIFRKPIFLLISSGGI